MLRFIILIKVIPCCLFFLWFNSFALGQDSVSNIFSVGIAVAPVYQPMSDDKDGINFATGLLGSVKLGNKSILKFTTGVLYDIRKYGITDIAHNYCNGSILVSNFSFNYIRVPMSIDLYFSQRKVLNPYISFGISLNTTTNKAFRFYSDYAGWNNPTFIAGGGLLYKLYQKNFLVFAPTMYRFFNPVVYGLYENVSLSHTLNNCGTDKSRNANHARNTLVFTIMWSYLF